MLGAWLVRFYARNVKRPGKAHGVYTRLMNRYGLSRAGSRASFMRRSIPPGARLVLYEGLRAGHRPPEDSDTLGGQTEASASASHGEVVEPVVLRACEIVAREFPSG